MVYVYVMEVSNLPDPKEQPQMMTGLPDKRKEKILRFKQKKDRIQSLGASLLLDSVLKKHGFSMEQIRYNKHGKPEIDGFYFNLSHSYEMAVCAVSEKAPVGCDVEKIGKAPLKVASRYFCENEIAHLESLGEEEKNAEFYRIWTMKESYMKMTGEGLGMGLDSVEIIFEDPIKVMRSGNVCQCSIKEYEIPGYKLTICAQERDFYYHSSLLV